MIHYVTITREPGWRPAYTEVGICVETAWRPHRAHPAGYLVESGVEG